MTKLCKQSEGFVKGLLGFLTFFFAFMNCIEISIAHRCVLQSAHLIGKDSHEQNADTTGNEAIMARLSVYIAICQFNNLWLLEGIFLSGLCLFRVVERHDSERT